MLHRTEGIVLRSIPFAEADLIVTVLTLDFGLVKVFAKSPRKIGSRFGSSLEPLTYSKISFWGKENKDLPRLTQSDIIKNFQSLRKELWCFFELLRVIELTLRVVPEREAHPEVFYLLLKTLNKIEDLLKANEQVGLHTISQVNLFYCINLLDLSGFGPRLKGCARCARSGLNFYLSHGSVLCEDCASEDKDNRMVRLTPQMVSIYETLRRWDISKIERIKLTTQMIKDLFNILDAHIRYTLSCQIGKSLINIK